MNSPDQRSDEDLANSLAQGDPSPGAVLASRYVRPVYDFATRVSLDPQAAADYTEAAIERALDNLRDKPASLSFRAWLFGIARDEVLEGMRQRSRPGAPEESAGGLSAADPLFIQASGLRGGDESERGWAWQAARGQRPRDYSILDLLLRRQLPAEEIAEIASLSRNGVYAVLGRLRGNFEESFASSALYHAGRDSCPDLNAIISSAQSPGPALRREIARHAEGCRLCGEFRSSLPSAVEIFEGLDEIAVPADEVSRLYPPLPAPVETGTPEPATEEPEAVDEPEAVEEEAAESEAEETTGQAIMAAEELVIEGIAPEIELAAEVEVAESLTLEESSIDEEETTEEAESETELEAEIELEEPEGEEPEAEAAEPEVEETTGQAIMAAEELVIEEIAPEIELAAEVTAEAALDAEEYDVEVEEPEVDEEVAAAQRALNPEDVTSEEPSEESESSGGVGPGMAAAGLAATAGLAALEGDLADAEAADLDDVDSTSVSSSQPPLLPEDEADLLDEEPETFEEEAEADLEVEADTQEEDEEAEDLEEDEYEDEEEEDYETGRAFAPLAAPLGRGAAMSFPRADSRMRGEAAGAGGPPVGPSWASEEMDDDDGEGGGLSKYLVYAAIAGLTLVAIYLGIAVGSSLRGGGGGSGGDNNGSGSTVPLPTPLLNVKTAACPGPVQISSASSIALTFADAPGGYTLTQGTTLEPRSAQASASSVTVVSQSDNTILFVASTNAGAGGRTDEFNLTAEFVKDDDSLLADCIVQVKGASAAPTATKAAATATSTPTEEPPTATPTQAVFIPLPTDTPLPTETPAGTPTPEPTNTPAIAVGTLLTQPSPTPTAPVPTPTP